MAQITLTRSSTPRVAHVKVDETLTEALRPFDVDPDKPTEFYPFTRPAELPEDFGIGLIVGASGSGKSTLLAEFGVPERPSWDDDYAIASHFDSAEDAYQRLYAVGLNSIPVWRQPFYSLSNGQQFRADLARCLRSGAVVDEFTSVVDRNVAKAASRAIRGYVGRAGLRRLVFASCHHDIIDWLIPDWTIDTDAGLLTIGESVDVPQWYAQHVTGDEVGRLVLA